MIGASVAVLVCALGQTTLNHCRIEDRETWSKPTVAELTECYLKAQALNDKGESARCEIVDIDDTYGAQPEKTSYAPRMQRWVM